MTPEQEQLLREVSQKIDSLVATERYTFQKHLQLFDGRNIQTGRTTGTKFGTATDQLLSFYGVTPVNQPATVADPAGGAVIDIECRARLVEVIDRFQELGLIA